jgi:hypothetical protein
MSEAQPPDATEQSSPAPQTLPRTWRSPAARRYLKRYQPAWLIGLPALLALLALLSSLFSPLQTHQLKEGSPLGGEGTATLTYRLKLDQPQPQKLVLKLAGTEPVKTRLLTANGQTELLAASLTPPAELAGVGLDLSGHARELEQAANQSPQGLLLELNFSGLRWQVGYWDKAPVDSPKIFKGSLGQNPQPGDLYYQLDYAPDPGRLLANFFERQQAFGGWPGLALLVFGAALAVFFGGLVYYARQPGRTLQASLRTRPGYLRYSGFVLALALSWALAYLLINPPLQGPDEPGHTGRSIGMGRQVAPESLRPQVSRLMQATNFSQNFSWLTTGEDPVNLFPPTAEFYQGSLYYQVSGLLVGLFKPSPENFTAEVYLARLASVLFFLGTVGAALVAGWSLRRDAAWLALGLPLTTALWPQLVFLGSVSNNDNAAICFMAWAACGLLLLYKAKGNWQSWAGPLALLLTSLGLGILAKRTAISVLPGFGLGLAGLLLLRQGGRVRWVVAGLSGLFALAVLALLVTQSDGSRAAKGWYVTPFNQGVHAPRARGEGVSGSAGLRITEKPVEQAIDLFFRPDINHLFLTTNARSLAGTNPVILKIEFIAGGKPLVTGQAVLSGSDWREVALETAVPPEVSASRLNPFVVARFSIDGPGAANLDELRLTTRPNEGENLLVNPGLEESSLTPASDWTGAGPYPVRSSRTWLGDTLDFLSNGRGLDLGAALGQSLSFVLVSGWGAFGWGQVFLAVIWYLVWGLLTAGVLVGLGLLAWRRKLAAGQVVFGLFCLATVLLTFGLLQVYDYLALMYNGVPDIVAGRYIFVAWLPLALLWLAGLRGLVRPTSGAARVRAGVEAGSEAGAGSGLWAWASWLLVINLISLAGTIFQFYYN